MANIKVKGGAFILDCVLDHPPPEPDEDIKHAAKFSVQFVASTDGKYGILQLIRALVNVGAYEQNKTPSGWAVDKQPRDGAGASNQAYMLVYGITGDNIRANPHSWFGSGPTQAARTEDTPTEFVKAGASNAGDSTKFAHYAIDLANHTVYDEGMIWSYNTSGILGEPKSTFLSKSKDHKDAIAKYLANATGKQTPFNLKIV